MSLPVIHFKKYIITKKLEVYCFFLGFTMPFYSNLNCITVYAVLDWANDTKLLVFAIKHEANVDKEVKELWIHSVEYVSI